MLDRRQEEDLVNRIADRLRSFTARLVMRQIAEQHFDIPVILSDADALRILARAIEMVDGEI